MSAREDDTVTDASGTRSQGEAYRYGHPPRARQPGEGIPSAPKRPRLRPEYDFCPRPQYPRVQPVAGPVDYWNHQPPVPPPYALDPSMIPAPAAHYNHYATTHSTPGYDYPYDSYGYSAYPGSEYGEPYPMGNPRQSAAWH